MAITLLECEDTNNYPNNSIVPKNIELKNYKYIPIYIQTLATISHIWSLLFRAAFK